MIYYSHNFHFLTQDEKSEVILESYVRYLASEERTSHLVANYTATLNPVKQVIVYSDFLKTVEDKDLRQQFLELANDAGMQETYKV